MNLSADSLTKTPDHQSGIGGSRPTSALHFPRELRFDVCPRKEVSAFVEKHHYSHQMNGVRSSFCFRVTADDKLVGAAIFGGMGSTAWRRFSTDENSVLELRKLVLLDELGKNCETRFLGWTLRWLKSNAHYVRTVVSYADPAHGHSGVIYRASNFKDRGLTSPDTRLRDPDTGKTYHSRSLKSKYTGGDWKPFAKILRAKFAEGRLEIIKTPGKHCYTYSL